MPQPLKDGFFKRWRVPPPAASAAALAAELGVHPLVAEVLCRRGFAGERGRAEAARAFLDPKLTSLADPRLVPGCEAAAERLARALRDREPVAIYGDYDVDGITATAILYHTLKAAAPDAVVHRYVPHRLDEGYGLNAEAIDRLAADGARVIVSVDCGITALEPAARAAERGVDLIITDHHQPRTDGQLPRAMALVHPGLGCGEAPGPSRDLCGAGVAYKLAWQLARAWCGAERVGEPFRRLLLDLLALAALGTVADVVPLVAENRVITTFGLRRIKETRLQGLNALIDAASLRGAAIDSYHVGFVLGPRINACGRLGHARAAVDLLTVASADEAARIAHELNSVNESRRATEREIFEQARRMVVERGDDRDEVRAIVLGHPGWHQGVVGIVCSRLVEAFGRPTILVDTMKDVAAGSARSIDGFDMIAALDACRAHLVTYGGHTMAAGLKLRRDELERFRAAFVRHAGERLTPDDLVPAIDVDAETTLGALSVDLCHQLERLGPFGRANPAPTVLVRGVTLAQPAQLMGRENSHLSLKVASGRCALRCVGWSMGQLAGRLRAGARLDLVGEPKINRWQGNVSVQLQLEDLRESS